MGDAGYESVFTEDKTCKQEIEVIAEEKHPYYLHFRIFELLVNPQGGFYYPKRKSNLYGECITLEKGIGKNSSRFDFQESGIIEFIAYRDWTSKDQNFKQKIYYSITKPFFIFGYVYYLVPRLIVYTAHDLLKTVYIPYAYGYYSFKESVENDENEKLRKAKDKLKDKGILEKPNISFELEKIFQENINEKKQSSKYKLIVKEKDFRYIMKLEKEDLKKTFLKTKERGALEYLIFKRIIINELKSKNLKKANTFFEKYKNEFTERDEDLKIISQQLNTKDFLKEISKDSNNEKVFSSKKEDSFGGNDIYLKKGNEEFHFPKIINTSHEEIDPFLSFDEKVLVFASDRPGGYFNYERKGIYFGENFSGNTDIYISILGTDSKYSRPINLGPIVNTPLAERYPVYINNSLYFYSSLNSGLCELQLYKTNREDDTYLNWETPRIVLDKAPLYYCQKNDSM
ncbi:MAG: hypothetical protein SFU98_09270 [Leptospiraceae bacterium]|nr:hypothetical protein [Leptospiraceae bacterium]